MRGKLLSLFFVALFAALTAACGHKPDVVDANTLSSPYDPEDIELKIEMESAKQALNSGTKISQYLGRLGAPAQGTLRDRIDDLTNRPGNRLAGLGGIQTRTSLLGALLTLGSGGTFDGELASVEVTGQIQEKVWGESGFYFKDGDPMHMWVQVLTAFKRGSIVFGKAEMFRIEIPAGGATVEAKDTTNPSDVFPVFGGEAFPITSQMATGFDYKLWAVGEDVSVTNYWIDRTWRPGRTPNYRRRFTATNAPPWLRSIFDPDSEACIDMMFAVDPRTLPGGELPPGMGPPTYCLGRCKNPPVVNTK